jgi:hypothetical protein
MSRGNSQTRPQTFGITVATIIVSIGIQYLMIGQILYRQKATNEDE